MRYAVLSDVHANLEALEAVLKEIDGRGVDRIVSLGDIVGYNANPNECLQILLDREVPTIMGNHDAVACGVEQPLEFNPIARAAVLWTRDELRPELREHLRKLPDERNLSDTIRLAHGSVVHRDHYLMSRRDILENVARMHAVSPPLRILFFGHTHHQVALSCDGEDLSLISSSRFTLREQDTYLINPGSVGQPRDQDPRAAFLIYDEEARTVEFVRLAYDISACARKILNAGLPVELADRLSKGW